jgi:hypothetical protein
MRRTHVAMVGALPVLGLLAPALPPAASADIVTSRDRGGVPPEMVERFALTPAERRALDIDSVQITGQEGLGAVIDVRFKADAPRAPGALRRVELDLDPPTEGFVDVRVGSSVKFLLRGAGYAGLERVGVVSSVGARRAHGVPVEADSQEIALDPADTTPHRHECVEAAPMYDDITQAIGALDTRIFRLERSGRREGRAWRRLRAKHDVALGLGGDAEGAYPRIC